jgi:HSP20 family protein
MNYIIRRDPFREMLTLRSAMDRWFDNAFFANSWDVEPVAANLALDVTESENEFVVKASLPGFNPDDLEITFSDKILTIQGEYKAEEEKEGEHVHMRERRFGKFARSLTLPAPIQSDAIQAHYEAGVLTPHLPKTEEVKPKRIAVNRVETPQMIESKAADIAGKN